MLLSASHLHKFANVRKAMNIDDDSTIFIDSGGYSLATGVTSEKKWNNQMAFDWSMTNGNLFPILDRPLFKGADFNKNLDLSIESAEFYSKNKCSEDVAILNVVHGRTISEVDKWIDSMSHIENINEWAIGSVGGNPRWILEVISRMMFKKILTKETKILHLFGTSGATNMIYFSAIQKTFKEMGYKLKLTFDSSYFQRAFSYGNFFMFKNWSGMSSVLYSNTFDYSNIPENIEHPYSCEVCKDIVDLKSYFENKVEFYMLGLTHNLNQVLTYKRAVDNTFNMDMPDILKSSFPAHIFKNINLIDSYLKSDTRDKVMLSAFKHKEKIAENQPIDITASLV